MTTHSQTKYCNPLWIHAEAQKTKDAMERGKGSNVRCDGVMHQTIPPYIVCHTHTHKHHSQQRVCMYVYVCVCVCFASPQKLSVCTVTVLAKFWESHSGKGKEKTTCMRC